MTAAEVTPRSSHGAAWERRFRAASAVLSVIVIVIGLGGLIGWGFDIVAFKSVLPRFESMKPNTALLFVGLGVGMWLARSRSRRAVRAKRVLGIAVATAAAVTLAQYVLGVDLEIDELLFRDPADDDPARMAPTTGLLFMLLGLALLFQDEPLPSIASRAAALIAAIGALIVAFGYLYSATSLYAIGLYTSISIPSTVAFLLASCALLMSRPTVGITRLLTGDSASGRLLRRLVPAIILAPTLIGWVQLRGQSAGYYDARFGAALMTLSTVISLTLLSAIIAASFHRSELRRAEGEAARLRLLEDVQAARACLQADVEAMTSLNRVATLFFPQSAPLQPVLAEIVAAAIRISDADFGSIQILDPRSNDLRIVAHQGFPAWWIELWDKVSRGLGACGTALECGERVIVEDIEASPIFLNTAALDVQRRAGVRAVQSTPLVTRSSEPIGMFSTHYTRPHRPDERTLRWLDLLARQAADIIERARSDQLLHDREQRFRALVDASAQIVWSTDTTGSVAEDSPSWRGFTGQTYAELRGSGWLDALHPGDRDRVAGAWQDAVRSQAHFETEYRVRHHSGQWRWTSVRAVPLRDAEGNASGWIGMNIDITARRLAEAARERQRREIVENSPHAIAMLDTRMRYVEASPRWLRDYGLGPDAIGRSHYELFPDLSDHWKEVHRRCLAGATEQNDGEPFVRKDGRVQWVRWKICPWRDVEGAIAGILIYADDITPERAAQESMRAMHEQLRLAQRVARIGTFDLNIQTGVNTWTPELEQMYGLPVGGFARTQPAWENLLHPDDRPQAVRRVAEAFETGAPTEEEWRVRWPDGSLHWLSGRFQVFKDEAGRPLRMIGINIEITEQKRAEQQRERLLGEVRDLTRNLEARVTERTREVAHARDRLDGIISLAADAIISLDENQQITIFNRGAEEIFGWTRDEVLGQPLDLLIPGRPHGIHRDHVAGLATEPTKARKMAERRTVFGRRKSGEEFPAEAAISKQPIDGGTQFTVILRDITERKRLEDEQARRYAEREVLLREIHHRVKNNLQVISSLFYLQAQRTDQETVRGLLEDARGRLQSIALIHEKLYRAEELAAIDFGDYLRDFTRNLTSAIGQLAPLVDLRVEAEGIRLDLDLAIPCALIVNELVSNSMKHAFPDGRRGEIRIAASRADSEFRLEVTDSGVGFPAELDFSNVTTLGLQLVASLTKQLRGTMELVRGHGTTFRIRFPANAAAQQARTVPAMPSK